MGGPQLLRPSWDWGTGRLFLAQLPSQDAC